MCGSGTTSSNNPRGSFNASASPNNKMSMAGFGSTSVNITGCHLPTNQDCLRKSRSQGGKTNNRSISTAHANNARIRA